MEKHDKELQSPELIKAAIASVRAWEHGERQDLVCPICGTKGLEIIDKSARPHTQWFALCCKSCGLDEAVCIPGAAHSSDHD